MPGKPKVLSASTLIGDGVRNPQGEDLGKIEELMIDLDNGRIAYAVLSFGGIMGIGDKLFAIPWSILKLSPEERKFILDVPKDMLKKAPGFDKDNWPDTGDRRWQEQIYTYYEATPYWTTTR